MKIGETLRHLVDAFREGTALARAVNSGSMTIEQVREAMLEAEATPRVDARHGSDQTGWERAA